MIFGKKKEKKYLVTITSIKVFQKRFKFFFENKRAIRSKIKTIKNGQKLMKNFENR